MSDIQTKGKNYTVREKFLLLSIIETKKDIIESKKTSVEALKKKVGAWDEVVQEFNSAADGIRTQKQLKILYDNLKRRARKDLAADNRQQYETIEKELNLPEGTSSQDIGDLIAEAKKELKITKVEISKTGGGPNVAPGVSGTSSKILAILGDKVVPDSNPYDSAFSYYGGIDNRNLKSVEIV